MATVHAFSDCEWDYRWRAIKYSNKRQRIQVQIDGKFVWSVLWGASNEYREETGQYSCTNKQLVAVDITVLQKGIA